MRCIHSISVACSTRLGIPDASVIQGERVGRVADCSLEIDVWNVRPRKRVADSDWNVMKAGELAPSQPKSLTSTRAESR